jgi:hypothetical protein
LARITGVRRAHFYQRIFVKITANKKSKEEIEYSYTAGRVITASFHPKSITAAGITV